MVDVAQLVSATGCGPVGREFKSRHPPHLKFSVGELSFRRFFVAVFLCVMGEVGHYFFSDTVLDGRRKIFLAQDSDVMLSEFFG